MNSHMVAICRLICEIHNRPRRSSYEKDALFLGNTIIAANYGALNLLGLKGTKS